MILSNKINYGDTLGIVGVSGPIGEREEHFVKSEKFLTEKGFKLKFGKYVRENEYGSCGTPEMRAEDFNAMICDDEVKAIICLTGGETCNCMLDLIDYEAVKKHPKIVVGYSNVTVLLYALMTQANLIGFSGPSFLDFGSWKAEDQFPVFENAFIQKKADKFKNSEFTVVRGGDMSGTLIGTNLGTMIHLLGTKYFPDMTGAVLAVEFYEATHNRCRRTLTQLKQCGVFDKINGIIVGYNYSFQENGAHEPQVEDWLLEYTSEYSFPIVKCNTFGHRIINAILPIGSHIEIKNGKITEISEFLI